MKKAIVIILAVLSFPIYGQEKQFKLSLGVNQSWLYFESSDLDQFKKDFVPKPQISLLYNFSRIWDLYASAGVRYFSLGRTSSFDYWHGRTEKFENYSYYLSVPVQIKYYIECLNMGVLINAEPAYLVYSSIKGPDIDVDRIIRRTVTDEMQSLAFLIGTGLEYIFTVGDEKFAVNAIYNCGLTKIPKKDIFTSEGGTDYSWAPYSGNELSLSLSYYF